MLKMEQQFNENDQISKNLRRSQSTMYVGTKGGRERKIRGS